MLLLLHRLGPPLCTSFGRTQREVMTIAGKLPACRWNSLAPHKLASVLQQVRQGQRRPVICHGWQRTGRRCFFWSAG
jgi:hypothetical protein